MIRGIYIAVVIMCFALNVDAQINCGTEPTEMSKKYKDALKQYVNSKSSSILSMDTVPVTVHVIVSEDFPNAITASQLSLEIGFSNKYFEEVGIHFVNCGAPRIIQGKSSYQRTELFDINRIHHVPNTLNIYYADQVAAQDFGLCGFVSAFPWDPVRDDQRFVVMAKHRECLSNGSTIAHELGHFYGLLHTHETFMGRELVDGSNCSSAGDGFCDTPADPRLGFENVTGSCEYIGIEVDPNQQRYSPNVRNIMSYSRSICANEFSLEQIEAMKFNHADKYGYLNGDCSFPDFTLNSNTTLPSFRSDQKINIEYNFQNVGTEQENFLVPVFIYLSENEDELGMIIQRESVEFNTQTSSIIKDLDINFPLNRSTATYYLTIVIDPNSEILEQDEENNVFRTELVIDNTDIEDEVLYPNPTSGKMRLFIRDTRLAQDMDVFIFNAQGLLMKKIEGFKNRDEFFTELDVSELHNGLYFMEVYFEKQKTSKSFKFFKEN